MGGSSGNQTTTSRVELPAYENAAREELFNSARNLYTNYAPQYFPRSTVAQMSPYTQGAIDELSAYGTSPFQTAINQTTGNTISNLSRVEGNSLQSGISSGLRTGVGNAALATPNNTAGAQAGLGLLRNAIGENAIAPSILDVNSMRGDASGIRQAAGRDVSLGNLNASSGPALLDGKGADFLSPALMAMHNNVGDQNPFVSEAIRRGIAENNRQFQETVLPSLRLGAVGENALNNSRSALAEGLAASRLGEANARVATEASLGAFENSRARELQAANLGAQLATTAEAQNLQRTTADRQYGLSRAGLQAEVDRGNIERDIAGLSTAAGVSGGALSGSISGANSQVGNTLAGLNLGTNLNQADLAETIARLNLGLSGAGMDANIRSTGTGLSLDASRINAGFLPVAQQMPLMGTEALARAGTLDEAYRQRLIDDERARFDFYQGQPETRLANYAGLISGNSTVRPYSTSSTAPSGGTSTAAGALGGAATGAGLASALTSAGAINGWNPAGWLMMLAGAGLGAYSASQS